MSRLLALIRFMYWGDKHFTTTVEAFNTNTPAKQLGLLALIGFMYWGDKHFTTTVEAFNTNTPAKHSGLLAPNPIAQ